MTTSSPNRIMTLSEQRFYTDLQPVFLERDTLSFTESLCSRELFFKLIHRSEHTDILPVAYCYLKQQLLTVEQHGTVVVSRRYQPNSVDNLPVMMADIILSSPTLLSHYAPILLTEFQYFQSVLQAANSQSPLALQVMAIYLQLTGSTEAYLPLLEALLQHFGHIPPAVYRHAFVEQTDIDDKLFDFAALQLAFTPYCQVFFPEMLGFSLACCKTTLFAYDLSHEALRTFIDTRQRQLNAQIPTLVAVIEQMMASSAPDHVDILWQRVQNGFYLYQQQVQHCQLVMPPALASLEHRFIHLLQAIAPKAVGYHGRIKLAGKGLDEWFSHIPFEGNDFLLALKQSKYINKAIPEYSVLLRLFDFGGPMFGVLDHTQRTLLKDWVLSEATTPCVPHVNNKPSSPQRQWLTVMRFIKTDHTRYERLSHRQLYYYLVNADVFPSVLSKARQHVRVVLQRAHYLNRLPFKQYSHVLFSEYIQRVYQTEVDNYRPLQDAPVLSKQAYLWGIEQFAPAILTDGCWLQHTKQLMMLANRSVSDILFKIYDDETGNGVLWQNHPFMYQQLLDSVAITLPAVHTKAFCDHANFINSAFDIPVYLLAISQFPSAFLPELLGLNMAIEISGLGKVYLRLAQALRYYGIDPAIVNVHISIDNLATGHSALAMQAIKHYMDDVLAQQGQHAMQQHWRRIYTGYCSLQTVSMRFKYDLVMQYWLARYVKRTL